MATRQFIQFMLLFFTFILSSFTNFSKLQPIQNMSKNKETVTKYMEGFNATDHAKILSCLTEDVIWELPGAYLHKGKAAFDKEIENEAFTGKPIIKVTRMIEEDNVVIAEGTVKATKKDGTVLNLVFCDVFELEDGLIKKLTSYLMTTP
ncbi:nuclear transport factor 2 family protein [Dyadobacter arcticus]|uniref:Ketosteroid isomerase-like protein n=1 Tax=Dyadobacter arcticus TaxID=1078754 RepID=A0ABX0URY7_9BACT|nr:nuclear transport factor 2 family protein [Dyadobacter arcticus]NIJ54495.1 ketosteroid isomerase-like protein [Dyadobacter arcticus]